MTTFEARVAQLLQDDITRRVHCLWDPPHDMLHLFQSFATNGRILQSKLQVLSTLQNYWVDLLVIAHFPMGQQREECQYRYESDTAGSDQETTSWPRILTSQALIHSPRNYTEAYFFLIFKV